MVKEKGEKIQQRKEGKKGGKEKAKRNEVAENG